MSLSVLLVDPKDNVATAVRPLEKGQTVEIGSQNITVTLLQPIPFGHKLALTNIRIGNPIIKYGEIIGLATLDISAGEHVHIHNVEGRKGRGDKV
jgi:altronate dehydratase small subunit